MANILQGDCREQLRTLAEGSVQCVVTSPPYWGLRDYGVEGQLGLEPTPDAYVANMVAVFREVRRVLRDDGTVWLNMGDSYTSGGRTTQADPSDNTGKAKASDGGARRVPVVDGLKPKDLCMIPARLALALQADGWYLRSDIIWAKGLSFCPSYSGSVMPESVTDRPTTSHEHVFLLTKSARYYYDNEAVREQAEYGRRDWSSGRGVWDNLGVRRGKETVSGGEPSTGRNLRSVWAINPQPLAGVVSRGSYRIALPGCPVHDRPGALVAALQCGELQVASGPARSLGIGESPESAQEGVAYAMSEDQCGSLSDATAARAHSNEIRRTVAELARRETDVDTQVSGTECKTPRRPSDTAEPSTALSNSAEDCAEDEMATGLWERTAPHILGIATFEPRSFSCTCHLMGKCEKRQDHYASFPMALVEPCIKAGTSEKGQCRQCGAPWVREVEADLSNIPSHMETKRGPVDLRGTAAYLRRHREAAGLTRKAVDEALGTTTLYSWFEGRPVGTWAPTPEQWTKLKGILSLGDEFDAQIYGTVEVEVIDHTPSKEFGVKTGWGNSSSSHYKTTRWSPSCACDSADMIGEPQTVLDPFCGSGTTGVVALRLGRKFIGIDLSPEYCEMAERSIIGPLFA